MSKDKDKKKSKHKDNDKKRSRSPESEIAKAEKRLAKALNAVDEAREQLIAREQELRDLLQKHGRMPQDADTSSHEAMESERNDRHVHGEQAQDAIGDSPDGASSTQQSTVPLFDQRQAVMTPRTGAPGADNG